MEDFTREQLVVQDLFYEDGIANSQLETWFDVNKKFDLNIADDDDTYVNMYASFDVRDKKLSITTEVVSAYEAEFGDYIPTEAEEKLIVSLMQEYCQKEYGCSMEELEDIAD